MVRPTMSPNRPMGSSSALMVRACPITTHWMVARSVPKSEATDGRAMLTLPWSTTELNMPMANAPITQYL